MNLNSLVWALWYWALWLRKKVGKNPQKTEKILIKLKIYAHVLLAALMLWKFKGLKWLSVIQNIYNKCLSSLNHSPHELKRSNKKMSAYWWHMAEQIKTFLQYLHQRSHPFTTGARKYKGWLRADGKNKRTTQTPFRRLKVIHTRDKQLHLL